MTKTRYVRIHCGDRKARSAAFTLIELLVVMAIIATLLTLLFLPALYAAWFKVKRDDPPPNPAVIGALSGGRP